MVASLCASGASSHPRARNKSRNRNVLAVTLFVVVLIFVIFISLHGNVFGNVFKVVVGQALFLDVLHHFVRRAEEFSEILFVEENLVLFVPTVVYPLALRDGNKVVVTGSGALHVKKIGAFTGGNAFAKHFIATISVIARTAPATSSVPIPTTVVV
jgi:hypothetical protein